MFSFGSILCTTWSSELKLLSLHPYLALTLIRLNTADMWFCQWILAPWIQRLLWITLQCIIHRGMCLLKRLFSKVTNHILQVISHFYIKRFRLGPTLHVYHFTMPYPPRIIPLNFITQKMVSYVADSLPSPVQKIYARTKNFPFSSGRLLFEVNCRNCSSPSSYAGLKWLSFIQLWSIWIIAPSCSVTLSMHDISLFHLRCGPILFRKTHFYGRFRRQD